MSQGFDQWLAAWAVHWNYLEERSGCNLCTYTLDVETRGPRGFLHPLENSNILHRLGAIALLQGILLLIILRGKKTRKI